MTPFTIYSDKENQDPITKDLPDQKLKKGKANVLQPIEKSSNIVNSTSTTIKNTKKRYYR